MLVLAVAYRAKPGCRGEALRAARACSAESRRETGNMDYTFYAGIDDESAFFLFEQWESREALDAHLKTRHVAEFRAALRDLLEAPASVRVYEVSSTRNGL
ncbi:MAG TPA: putative quinol monooxygenase [Magnetospirillaceae bacterium]|nr:putative quinol monooxygenase [Magnetospirillaceae bacterium]